MNRIFNKDLNEWNIQETPFTHGGRHIGDMFLSDVEKPHQASNQILGVIVMKVKLNAALAERLYSYKSQ